MRSLLAWLILSSAGFAGDAPDAPDPVALQRLVHHDCGSCHGMTLKGGLGPDLRTGSLSHYDAMGLTRIILDGVDGTAMPPWRPIMSEADALWIAQYLLKGEAP